MNEGELSEEITKLLWVRRRLKELEAQKKAIDYKITEHLKEKEEKTVEYGDPLTVKVTLVEKKSWDKKFTEEQQTQLKTLKQTAASQKKIFLSELKDAGVEPDVSHELRVHLEGKGKGWEPNVDDIDCCSS